MYKKIHHIGIAVRNLDEALGRYRDQLGFQFEGRETVESENVEVAIFLIGESRIELLQSTEPGSVISKFIEKRGEGIHHISMEVDDIDESLEELKNAGAPVIDEQPRIGAGGHRVAFVHPKGTSGVLLELIDTS
ncbi:MAG: methylmalonyl-CoA epimerase [Thermoplasmata archaeon]|nr:methylmalonyl-CoA epimerase [Thermoplasmata archaeon]